MSQEEDFIKSGDQFFQKDKYIDAIREYTKAADIAKGKNDEVEAEIYSRLSQAYNALEPKNDENSLKYGLMALEIHKKLNIPELEVMDEINLGYIEEDAGKREEAKKHLQDALEMGRKLADPVLLSMAMNAYAEFLSSGKKTAREAMDLYLESAEISRKAGEWENYFEAMYGYIGILKENNSGEAFKIAMDSLDKIDEVCKSIKNKKDRKDFRKSVSFMYDIASDISMENENVEEAIKIAQRLNSE
ncbi:MAG: tetratricopeptide repeat protein [Thermoplasmata archaeon]